MSPDSWIFIYLRQFAYTLRPYLAIAVGVALVGVTPLGRAAISWLKGHINRGRGAELAAEIDQLRAELGQVQERLDFAERLIAAPHDEVPSLPREATTRTPV